MRSFNRINIVGYLGRDPELKYTPDGKAVCRFSVATDDPSTKEATWFRVTVWNKQGEAASRYLTKGSAVYVEGRLSMNSWVDSDGVKRATLDVVASSVQFLESRAESATAAAAATQEGSSSDDDEPF